MFFSTKTITVEFGCNKADRPKMLAEPPADIVFDYTYMDGLKGSTLFSKTVLILIYLLSQEELGRRGGKKEIQVTRPVSHDFTTLLGLL